MCGRMRIGDTIYDRGSPVPAQSKWAGFFLLRRVLSSGLYHIRQYIRENRAEPILGVRLS
jgi:hypothetical protein